MADSQITETSTSDPHEKKIPRYYSPYSHTPVKPRKHAAGVVTSQTLMLENLRFLRRQMEREERELEILQRTLALDRYPKKWNNYKHMQGDNEDL